MLLGHTKQINGVWKIQSLKQHSENVAEYCARACQPLGLENLGRLTGWLHDVGKSHINVQKHLRGQTNEKINHSSAGMRWLWENYGGETASPPSRLTAQMAALAIGSHHSERMDLFDLGGVEPWIKHMYSEQAQELYEESCRAFFADCISETEIRQMFAKAAQEVECLVRKIRTQEGKKPRLCIYQVMLGLAHRFLFAALIDADWLDSGNYYNQEGCLPPEQLPPWDLIESNVETFLNNLQPRHKIDTLRAEISEQCKAAGECAKLGIYQNKVADNMAQYLVPQECGAKTAVRWAKVVDRKGRGLLFTADAAKPMFFSALPYTPHEMESAKHPYELPPVHYTVIRAIGEQMGVGGDDSWGANVHPEYIPDVTKPVEFTFTFRGI